jgi:aconitase A
VERNKHLLRADENCEYDEVIEIDLSTLEPHINGPHTPDRAVPLSKFKEEVIAKGWPTALKAALIGSCTNSSYQDMSRVFSIASQAHRRGIKPKTPLLITPGKILMS